MATGDQKIVENTTKIEGIEKDIDTIFAWFRKVEEKLDAAITSAAKRPGWAVCGLISVLLAAVAVLGTLLAAQIKGG